jgi:hypothetical protein
VKGMTGNRLAPANHGKGHTGHGSETFVPRIDREAKWHRTFDNLMNDTAHKKKMAKVTLPKIVLREVPE